MSHAYHDLLNQKNASASTAYDSLDAESGIVKRKISLVRRDRARPDSIPNSIKRSGSTRFRQSIVNASNTKFANSAPPLENFNRYADDGNGGIPMQNLSAPLTSNYHRFSNPYEQNSHDDSFSDANDDINSETMNPFKLEEDNGKLAMENQAMESPKKPKEILHLNDEFDNDPKQPFISSDHNNEIPDDGEEIYTAIPPKRLNLEEDKEGFPYWTIYCYIVTFWAPPPLLRLFGLATPDRQFAWREKMGLISIVIYIGVGIGFLTFAFTRVTCTNLPVRLKPEDITTGYMVINGRSYYLASSAHPAAPGIPAGSNILYPPINAGAKDGSLLFQNVNGNCKGLIRPKPNCKIPHEGDELAWYMPCKVMDLDGSTEPTFDFDYYEGYACHTSEAAREAFYSLDVQGDVFYTWESITNSSKQLVVYNGDVIDMGMLDWLYKDEVTYPKLFDDIAHDKSMRGYDISLLLTEPHERQMANCLVEIARVGVVDTTTIGCIASTVTLYASLVFILLLVIVQFLIACYFKWFIAPHQGAFYSPVKEMNERSNMIDNWVDDPSNSAPIQDVPIKRRANYHTASKANKTLRLSWGGDIDDFIGKNNQKPVSNTGGYHPKHITMTTEAYMMANTKKRRGSSMSRSSMLSTSNLAENPFNSTTGPLLDEEPETLDPALICADAIPQPPVSWEPFGYPLVHTMCLVTCYSEDEDGIRTTIDSIATTDYPNSHKLIVVICDGIITGAGNDKSTPDICLDMMTDLAVPADEVEAFSYVSVASGSKRHNMAKVYAGFYKYNDATVPPEKQQKTPMLLITKCGTPEELTSAKPGNRGKRDSQIILMSFLQAVTFNERMTPLQYEMLKSIWQVTGLMAIMYETILMVDADTLVYPDSLTHMVAEMVKDPEIMGLCGETKISNKAQSWVTAIQVFEYYISHHQAKAFESAFGSVTCLPGCFCMYRIKSPKSANVWVPILANSEIVEKYSDNVLNSLHKKNLLLLGEDRYLTSLMLRAFPRRKQVFVPKAACKTVVPDKFKVLLSQRRRWINSTVHNLMELVLVNDLCGTFCLSMQFVIATQLIGTLALPVSITFTVYVIITAIISPIKPIMSLVLLGIVFGLPAILIVLTVSNLAYLVWMLIYLFSLPIWNLVLPVYAFWKFDDFSWGDTRKTAGGDKGAHADVDGEFDGSRIRQMTWVEFELQRRQEEMAHGGVQNQSRTNIASVYHPGNKNYDIDEEYVDMSHKYDHRFDQIEDEDLLL